MRGSIQCLGAVTTQNLSDTVILNLNAGTADALAAGDLLIDAKTANSDNLKVGDTVPVKFALTGKQRMRIGGIYQDNSLIGSYLVGDAFFRVPLREPPAVRGAAADRRQPRRATCRGARAGRATRT